MYEVGIAIFESRVLWFKGLVIASMYNSIMIRSDSGINDDKLQKKGGFLTAHIEN